MRRAPKEPRLKNGWQQCTAEQVRSFKTEDALRFTRKLYRPDNAIFFAYGDIDFKKLVKLIRKALADDDSG